MAHMAAAVQGCCGEPPASFSCAIAARACWPPRVANHIMLKAQPGLSAHSAPNGPALFATFLARACLQLPAGAAPGLTPVRLVGAAGAGARPELHGGGLPSLCGLLATGRVDLLGGSRSGLGCA